MYRSISIFEQGGCLRASYKLSSAIRKCKRGCRISPSAAVESSCASKLEDRTWHSRGRRHSSSVAQLRSFGLET